MGNGNGKPAPVYSKVLARQFLQTACVEFEERWADPDPTLYVAALKDFKRLKTIGEGSFGRVMIVQHNQTREHLAMKILKKKTIVEAKQVQNTLNEKKILLAINFPFVVTLKHYFKDTTNLYMVMEFVNGGELFTHLRDSGRFSEEQTRFYTTQIVMTIEYLHNMDVIYRDLKPQNLLIDSSGYIKLTDFGFAKRLKGRMCWSFCGTPEYLAPEIIANKGYTRAVDWWALGIVIFEMYAGYSPFDAEENFQIFENIESGKYKFPSYFGNDIKDLISKLLENNVTKRFGNLKDGVEDIKNHRWFATVNWISIFLRNVKPPFSPKCKGPGDFSNFDECDEEPLSIYPNERFADEFADF